MKRRQGVWPSHIAAHCQTRNLSVVFQAVSALPSYCVKVPGVIFCHPYCAGDLQCCMTSIHGVPTPYTHIPGSLGPSVTLSRWLLSLLQFGPPALARPSTTLRVILNERLSTAPLRLPRPSLLDSAGALHLGMFQRALARAVPGFSCVPLARRPAGPRGQLEAARSRLARTAKLEM
jgi:hypothetical protein